MAFARIVEKNMTKIMRLVLFVQKFAPILILLGQQILKKSINVSLKNTFIENLVSQSLECFICLEPLDENCLKNKKFRLTMVCSDECFDEAVNTNLLED